MEQNSSSEENFAQDLKRCADSVAKRENFITYNVKIKDVPLGAGNYASTLYEIDIRGKTKDGDREVNLFVKKAIPVEDPAKALVLPAQIYMIEAFFYKELVKIFAQLQDEASVPIKERLKVLKGYDESSEEITVLENIARKGFETCDRSEVLSLRIAEMFIEQLAKLHALGFIIQKKMPEFYEHKISKLEYVLEFNEIFNTFYNNNIEVVLENLNDDRRKKLERLIPMALKMYPQYMKNTVETRTICHGDYRPGNIMVAKVNGEVKEFYPVDYQVVHMGCAANDLLFFLYLSTDREFRRQYMEHLVNFYHNAMKKFLKYFGMDITDIYSKDKLECELKNRKYFGLYILGYFPLNFVSEDNKLKMVDTFGQLSITLEPDIVKRIDEIIDDFEE